MKTFTPKELENVPQKLVNMRELSSVYFKVASELRDKAHLKQKVLPPHNYVFPSVIMYVSSLEAYLNENLWMSSFSVEDDELREKIDNIKSGSGEFKKLSARVKVIFQLFDKNKKGIDTNSLPYQNLVALAELRNSVAHYNPLFIEHVEWPLRLQQVLQRSKIDVMNTGWVSNFSNPAVATWAYETIKSIVQQFCSITNNVDPFNCPERDESFKWE